MTICNVLVRDDVTVIPASAVITAINPYNPWLGDVNELIHSCSFGPMVFSELLSRPTLCDGETLYVPAPAGYDDKFGGVFFLADMLKKSVYDLVRPALIKADKQQSKEMLVVCLPTIRTDEVLGFYENGPEKRQKVLSDLVLAVADFIAYDKPKNIGQIKIVAKNNKDLKIIKDLLFEAYV